MKNLQKTLGVVILLLIINYLNAQEPPITYGLVGYWPFNGNANDESDNMHHGTEQEGIQLTNDKCGNSESAYMFDNNQFIDIPDADDLSFGNGTNDFPFSLSLWIKPNLLNVMQGIIGKWNQAINSVEYSIWLRDNNKLQFILEDNSTNHLILRLYSDIELNTNEWYNIILTYDGNGINGLKMFINGVSQGTIINNDNGYVAMENTSQNLWIGRCKGHDGTEYFFNGTIDEVMIFNRALIDEDISLLQNSACDNCFSRWKCSENNIFYDYGNVSIGTGIFDYSGDSYRLAVDGKIRAKEIRVTLDDWGTWPDYIFNSNYQLKPLNQLENYIILNKHLPNIPSEKEVKEDGVSLGEMNAKLLEKIEELTLYIIEQNKKTEKLELKLEQIEKKNNVLENNNLELENRIIKLEATK